jgi:PAS domain S-box-containing protein
MDKTNKGPAEIKDLEWDAAFFHCIADQACDTILGIRLDGRICYANLHAMAMYGYTRDELCGMSIRELRAPETLTDFEEFFRRAAGGGIMFRTTHRRKDGLTFPVEVNSRGVDLPDGQIVVSIIRDNTINEKLTQKLQATRTISDCLLRAANVIVVILDCAGRIRFFNETAQRITGYASEEATGKDGFALLAPPDFEPVARNYFQACLCLDYVGTIEGPILTKTEERRSIAWQTFALDGADGVEGMLWLGVDATERVQAEELLQKKETFISSVVDGLQFPFFVLDRQYRYITYNAVHKKGVKVLFNADIEPGMDVLSYHCNPRHRAIAKGNFDKALAGQACMFEGDIGEEKYQCRPVLIEHNPVRDLTGEITGVAVVVHDIRGLREAEAKTREIQLQYKELVEDVPAIMMVVCTEGKLQYINPFGAETFNFSAEELAGRSLEETILPELESTGRNLWDYYRDLWAGPFHEYHHVNENMTKRGRRLWINWSIKGGMCPVNDGHCWICMGQDVTERHRALEREKHKQERTRQNEIMQDILSGRIPEKQVWEHLAKLGLGPKQPMSCFAIRVPLFDGSQSELSQQQELEALLDCYRSLSGGIAWEASGCVGVLVSQPKTGTGLDLPGLRKAAEEMWRKLRQCVGGGANLAGAAMKTDEETSVAQLFFQARSALLFGPCLSADKALYFWRDLGWLRLLVANIDSHESRRFVAEHLSGVLELADEDKRRIFLDTLRKTLDGRSVEEIAREMNVHKQTVRYRLSVLKQLLGTAELRGENEINVAIALRLHEMQTLLLG